MHEPLVTICVPNLNKAAFLRERFETILSQDYSNVEILVVDGESEDQSWQIIQEFVADDDRINAWQSPARGIYPAWNECIANANGEYIYFATSDDTMTADCISRMVNALKSYGQPAIAQCALRFIDSDSQPLPVEEQWYRKFAGPIALGNWLDRIHLREAPVDALLHAATGPLWTSHTQLLIDRRIYDKIGVYREDCSFAGDFEWSVRASLLFDTLYVPESLATLRKHTGQASGQSAVADDGRRLREIINLAYSTAIEIDPDLNNRILRTELNELFDPFYVATQVLGAPSVPAKIRSALHHLLKQPNSLIGLIASTLRYGHPRNHRVALGRKIIGERNLRELPAASVPF